MTTKTNPEKEVRIREGLLQLARETRAPGSLPGASELWWRAEIIRRWSAREDAVRQAERPLFWSGAAALFLGSLCLGPLLVSQAPPLVAVLLACGLTPVMVLVAWVLLRQET